MSAILHRMVLRFERVAKSVERHTVTIRKCFDEKTTRKILKAAASHRKRYILHLGAARVSRAISQVVTNDL